MTHTLLRVRSHLQVSTKKGSHIAIVFPCQDERPKPCYIPWSTCVLRNFSMMCSVCSHGYDARPYYWWFGNITWANRASLQVWWLPSWFHGPATHANRKVRERALPRKVLKSTLTKLKPFAFELAGKSFKPINSRNMAFWRKRTVIQTAANAKNCLDSDFDRPTQTQTVFRCSTRSLFSIRDSTSRPNIWCKGGGRLCLSLVAASSYVGKPSDNLCAVDQLHNSLDVIRRLCNAHARASWRGTDIIIQKSSCCLEMEPWTICKYISCTIKSSRYATSLCVCMVWWPAYTYCDMRNIHSVRHRWWHVPQASIAFSMLLSSCLSSWLFMTVPSTFSLKWRSISSSAATSLIKNWN